MKILFIGDIFGEPGRLAVREKLPKLRESLGFDFVIANVENLAHGKGITSKTIQELQGCGVDAFTSGNHVWDNKEVFSFIGESKKIVRPANYPKGSPGSGVRIFTVYSGVKVGLINVQGQIFMGQQLDSPYDAVMEGINSLNGKADIIVVDFHAEASSEKRMMGWFIDGKVAAVVGTHTHVQTADEEILPQGTAYITDVGMTGPYNSVIGAEKKVAETRLIRKLPASLKVASGDVRFCAVLIEIDEATRMATNIQRIQEKVY